MDEKQGKKAEFRIITNEVLEEWENIANMIIPNHWKPFYRIEFVRKTDQRSFNIDTANGYYFLSNHGNYGGIVLLREKRETPSQDDILCGLEFRKWEQFECDDFYIRQSIEIKKGFRGLDLLWASTFYTILVTDSERQKSIVLRLEKDGPYPSFIDSQGIWMHGRQKDKMKRIEDLWLFFHSLKKRVPINVDSLQIGLGTLKHPKPWRNWNVHVKFLDGSENVIPNVEHYFGADEQKTQKVRTSMMKFSPYTKLIWILYDENKVQQSAFMSDVLFSYGNGKNEHLILYSQNSPVITDENINRFFYWCFFHSIYEYFAKQLMGTFYIGSNASILPGIKNEVPISILLENGQHLSTVFNINVKHGLQGSHLRSIITKWDKIMEQF